MRGVTFSMVPSLGSTELKGSAHMVCLIRSQSTITHMLQLLKNKLELYHSANGKHWMVSSNILISLLIMHYMQIGVAFGSEGTHFWLL